MNEARVLRCDQRECALCSSHLFVQSHNVVQRDPNMGGLLSRQRCSAQTCRGMTDSKEQSLVSKHPKRLRSSAVAVCAYRN